LCAILTGFLLRQTILQGKPAPFIMELPPYHLPNFRSVFGQTWTRLKGFILKAGKFIVPICILIGALNAVTIHGKLVDSGSDPHTLLALLGQWFTPFFAPLGLHKDNWPATVGLLTGVLA